MHICTYMHTGMPQNTVTRIIGILNTNSHQLELDGSVGEGGTGVFLNASMMEHNCRYRCMRVNMYRYMYLRKCVFLLTIHMHASNFIKG